MATKTDQIELGVGERTPVLADLAAIRVGDTASIEWCITPGDIERFAALSGDVNQLHLSGDVAERCGFERPVAHGMLALAAISRLIGTELPGHGSLWVSQEVRFPAPVLAGDRVVARVTVEHVSLATGLVGLRTEVLNLSSQKTVLSGSAKVKIPARRDAAGSQPAIS